MTGVDFGVLSVAFTSLRTLFHEKRIAPNELLAAFLLIFVSHKHPERWLVGKLAPLKIENGCSLLEQVPLSVSEDYETTQNSLLLTSISHWMKTSEKDWLRLEKLLKKERKTVTICEMLENVALYEVDKYANSVVAHWNSFPKSTPLRLLFYIPSPEEMLNEQARGVRCVTLFTEKSQLESRYKDPYPPHKDHDALDFVLHDLQHAWAFIGQQLYYSQIGFAKFLAEGIRRPGGSILSEYMGKDAVFASDIEHAMADMNTAPFHSLCFLKAKLLCAVYREKYAPQFLKPKLEEEEKAEVFSRWSAFLRESGLEEQLVNDCEDICTREVDLRVREELCCFFDRWGKLILKSPSPNHHLSV